MWGKAMIAAPGGEMPPGGTRLRGGSTPARRMLLAVLLAVWGAGMTHTVASRAGGAHDDELARTEAWVRGSYADVTHMDTSALTQLVASGKPLAIFDVREAKEYAVSHIDGAARVDPGVWSRTFLAEHGGDVAGKTVVFYCSVGVRSSKLAGRVQAALLERGATGVYNLEGGIFRWHGDARPLVDVFGPTDRVHPYDKHWGRLVPRQDLIADEPRRPQEAAPTR
ncbi:MAG: rhodanese-like domain-containing protein [Hyphomicrobiaceae bacterium]